MATRRGCFRAGSWSERRTIRWRFASSRRMTIPTTTRSRRFLKEIEALFVKVLLLAREMGILNLGTVALDGTKIHANASRHSALSYEHAGKLETQLCPARGRVWQNLATSQLASIGGSVQRRQAEYDVRAGLRERRSQLSCVRR